MFWLRMFFIHPLLTLTTLWAAFMSRFKESTWVVLVETSEETGDITRHPSWPNPTTFETAMRRAKTENFQWVFCCSGKDEGLLIENPQWQAA